MMFRTKFLATLLLFLVLPLHTHAAFVSLISPNQVEAGSLGSTQGFAPELGAPGFEFDVDTTFSVSEFSWAGVVASATGSTSGNSLLNSEPIRSTLVISELTNGGFTEVFNATQNLSGSGDYFFGDSAQALGPPQIFDWYDFQLDFTFVAGNTYRVEFPFFDYVSVTGSNVGFFYAYGLFGNGGGPYSAEGLLTVTDGTLQGTRGRFAPFAGFETNANVAGIDRTFGGASIELEEPSAVPLPATLPLSLIAICCVLVCSMSNRSRRSLK